jgi:hypothetical protein
MHIYTLELYVCMEFDIFFQTFNEVRILSDKTWIEADTQVWVSFLLFK